MKTQFFRVSCLLLFIAVPNWISIAEDQPSTRGRLPDGRAFRTDVDGNQLVDYIAELEVGIETLNRQLESAQDELRNKDALLKNCKASTEEGLKEKSLSVPGEVKGPLSQVSTAQHCSTDCSDNSAKLTQAETEIRMLRDDRDIIAARLNEKLKQCQQELGIDSTRASLKLDSTSSETPPTFGLQPAAKSRALDALRGKINTQLNQVRNLAMTCGRTTGSSDCGQALLTIESLRRKAIEATDPASVSSITSEIQTVKALIEQAARTR